MSMTCRVCLVEKDEEEFYWRHDRGGEGRRTTACKRCLNARKSANRKVARAKKREAHGTKKLPPYAELRRLYLDEGLTQARIADKYHCSVRSVSIMMKKYALEAGDPWPLLSREEHLARVSAANKRRGPSHRKLPPYSVLKVLFLGEGMSCADIADIYHVHESSVAMQIKKGATERGEFPLLTPAQVKRRQVAGMRRRGHVKGGLIVDMVCERMVELGIPSFAQLAKATGVSANVFHRIVNGTREYIDKCTAVRLLEWLDEEVPHHLLPGPRPENICPCGGEIPMPKRGRPSKYCSAPCFEKYTGKKRKSAGGRTHEEEEAA